VRIDTAPARTQRTTNGLDGWVLSNGRLAEIIDARCDGHTKATVSSIAHATCIHAADWNFLGGTDLPGSQLLNKMQHTGIRCRGTHAIIDRQQVLHAPVNWRFGLFIQSSWCISWKSRGCFTLRISISAVSAIRGWCISL
jgi:hypothetical protein